MTTQRVPFKTRRWTEAEDAALRSLVEAGIDARMIGRELSRTYMGVQARVKKLDLTIVVKNLEALATEVCGAGLSVQSLRRKNE